MNKLMMQVGGVVAAVTIFALLAGVGYLTQIGLTQTFGPSAPASNAPPRKQPSRNRAYSNWVDSNQPEEEREPIPEGESVWEDYDDSSFKNKDRLANRPGNMQVVKKVGEFFEGMYLVEPDYADLAFPYNNNGKRIETAEAYEAANAAWEQKRRDDGRKERNKFRSYNVVIHKLTLLNLAEGETSPPNPAEYGFNLERLESVRKDHKERCCLVLIRATLESLQSEKIEGDESDADFVLCYVMKADGWKLVWFEK